MTVAVGPNGATSLTVVGGTDGAAPTTAALVRVDVTVTQLRLQQDTVFRAAKQLLLQ